MRGSSAKTQLRDGNGRFVSKEAFNEYKYHVIAFKPLRRPNRWSNSRRLLSHHRIAIAYVGICLVTAILGGYLGARIGLEGLGL